MDDLISRRQAIDAVKERYYKYGRFAKIEELVWSIENLPSTQPEEAIPVSWIESRIERLMMAGDAFTGLMASTIRVMLNEWEREQKGVEQHE